MDPNEPSRVIKIGKGLNKELVQQLTVFLRHNQDVFAWTHAYMIGIHPRDHVPLAEYRPTGEANAALQDEVDNLLKIGFIIESYYPDSLVNPILVIKPNGKCRTCIDFMNLNTACSKDSFPPPQIDLLVDATVRHELLSFIDAYSGYNQIPIYEPDEEHSSFITNRGLDYYKAKVSTITKQCHSASRTQERPIKDF